ncbi:MAG: methyltransferase [Chlamydiae bacterium]|nr:methyltransferase [Chlamydiota bacterium]
MPWFCFQCKQESIPALAEKELFLHHITHVTLVEDSSQSLCLLYGQGDPAYFPHIWQHIVKVTPIAQEIDWSAQWRDFCPYLQEDLCRIPLRHFHTLSSQELLLIPGGGFGDLSHPTTHLMLSLIGNHVQNKSVLDLGCGSGILSLASLLFGAHHAYAVDIDPKALAHTRENSFLNNLQHLISIETTPPSCHVDILLMNMTWGEQKEALSSLSRKDFSLWIVSGILTSQLGPYLAYLQTFPLRLRSIHTRDIWAACTLKMIVY